MKPLLLPPRPGFLCRLLLVVLLPALPLSLNAQTLMVHAGPVAHGPVQEDQKMSLRNALIQLEQKYQVVFGYETGLADQPVTSQAWQSAPTLDGAMRNLLEPLRLTYKKLGKNTYVIKAKAGDGKPAPTKAAEPGQAGADRKADGSFPGTGADSPASATAPQATVSGRVTNEKNEALPGVNVVLKGSTAGTTTNAEGRYSLTAPESGGILVFSFIGFLTEEVPVGNRTTLDVTLKADVKSLDEVVVVGYGTQNRRDVTGSISSVSGEELRSTPIYSVDQGLQGRAAACPSASVAATPSTPATNRCT